MTLETADAKGYTVFTGVYSRDKSEVEVILKEDKKKYPKAKFVIVTVPDSPLSRGTIGKGYGMRATKAYDYYNSLNRADFYLSIHNRKLLEANERYQQDLIQLEKDFNKAIEHKQKAEEFLSKL